MPAACLANLIVLDFITLMFGEECKLITNQFYAADSGKSTNKQLCNKLRTTLGQSKDIKK
jgi:hypothetical protein